MKDIGKVISENRKQKGISQISLAEDLKKYDIYIKNAAISAWEKGTNTPTAAQLLAVCDILGISDIYEEFIGENKYNPLNGLNDEGISKALEYIDLLKRSGLYEKKKASIIPMAGKIMKISLLSTSAGTGDLLDDENFEEVEIFDPVPETADFGVYLNGDSMEPQFKNDELVWIEKTDVLESGDIGLFYLDGKTYFKKYRTGTSGTFLVSLNAKYAPIQVQEFNSFKIFGKLASKS